jgi:hypothetical protein
VSRRGAPRDAATAARIRRDILHSERPTWATTDAQELCEVAGLDGRQREVVLLRCSPLPNGRYRSYAAIARLLRVTDGTIWNHLQRARQKVNALPLSLLRDEVRAASELLDCHANREVTGSYASPRSWEFEGDRGLENDRRAGLAARVLIPEDLVRSGGG